MLWTAGKYFIKSLEVPVIKQLTKSKFIDIATNGVQINLYDKFIEDYQAYIVFNCKPHSSVI